MPRNRPLQPDRRSIEKFIFESLATAHKRELAVGGLFNAYEQVLHYVLYNAALQRKLDAQQEMPTGRGQTSCDLVLPLANSEELWLEVKMWWFLEKAYDKPYFMASKTLQWPAGDWEKLCDAGKRNRAVLLMRVWDTEKANRKAALRTNLWAGDVMIGRASDEPGARHGACIARSM